MPTRRQRAPTSLALRLAAPPGRLRSPTPAPPRAPVQCCWGETIVLRRGVALLRCNLHSGFHPNSISRWSVRVNSWHLTKCQMKIIAWPFFPDLHNLRFHQYHSNRVLNCNNSSLIRTGPCSTIADQITSRNSSSSKSSRMVFTAMPALRTRPLVPSNRPRSLTPSLCRPAVPAPRCAAPLSCPRAPPVPRRHPGIRDMR